jgi:hypothetical protein
MFYFLKHILLFYKFKSILKASYIYYSPTFTHFPLSFTHTKSRVYGDAAKVLNLFYIIHFRPSIIVLYEFLILHPIPPIPLFHFTLFSSILSYDKSIVVGSDEIFNICENITTKESNILKIILCALKQIKQLLTLHL